MKTIFRLLLAILIPLLALAGPAYAQDAPELTLSLSRDWGYASGTGSIQGTFSMRASGPDDLVRVVFFIDGAPIGEATQPPFRLQFHTGDYALGEHSLSAVGYTAAGRELQSRPFRRIFVSAEEGMQTAGKIIIPLLAVVFAIMILSYGLPALLGRGKKTHLAPGTPRNYGPVGGTVCPKCGRPFALHFFKLNLLVGALDRCPYCGRWSLVHRYDLEALRRAEAAELQDAASASEPAAGLTEEERLRKELDDSRFRDT